MIAREIGLDMSNVERKLRTMLPRAKKSIRLAI